MINLVGTLLAEAVRHHQAGRLADAESRYRQILTIVPDHYDALHLLGVIAHQRGQSAKAVELIGKAISLNRKDPAAHNNLGEALRILGQLEEAESCFKRALNLHPDYTEAYNNLGTVLKQLGRLDEAIASYQRALMLNPNYAQAYSNLGVAFREIGDCTQAEESLRRSLQLQPSFAEAYNNLGNVLLSRGGARVAEAIKSFEQAIALRPTFAEAHHNLLMSLHYLYRHTESAIGEKARQYAQFVESSRFYPDREDSTDPRRQLRIGYVSGDFREHPVAFFLADVLPAHDRSSVEVYCYSNAGYRDAMTDRLQAGADHWRNIVGTADPEVKEIIRRDAIDILVDLSGHTALNRLSLFTSRPAPIQATWLGYFGTTGLSSIDYIIADRYVIPEGSESYFSEAVWRMPDSYLCFSPPEFDLPVGPLPMSCSSQLTFGCFNNSLKISQPTVKLWARLLNSLPESRLFLKTKQFNDLSVTSELRNQFSNAGVAQERILFEGYSPRKELLSAYARVDVALDPFPFGGGTTTAEALWMGVPVVTKHGDRWAGRVSESILRTAGLGELVARNEDEYVEIAVRLASDIDYLKMLRAGLRDRLLHSPLCQAKHFTKHLEAAYRSMWSARCKCACKRVNDFKLQLDE